MRKKTTLLTFKKLGEKQSWKCNLCRQSLESTAQVDHIQPLWLGGDNEIDNLQILCVSCHAKKTQQENDNVCRSCGTVYSKYFKHRCMRSFFSQPLNTRTRRPREEMLARRTGCCALF